MSSFDRIFLNDRSFRYLRDFVSENTDPDIKVDQAFSVHRSKGKDFITVSNYVGVIELRDHTTIEILPKIHLPGEGSSVEATRRIFLRMLRTLRDSPFASIDQAHLKSRRFPVLEVFISAFLNELELLCKRGLKQYYVNISENSPFLKGRIDFPGHLRNNLVNRERFYISYDIFSQDIPHNRIIRSTLDHLSKLSRLPSNQTTIRSFIWIFDKVNPSSSYHSDLSHIDGSKSRLYQHYDKVLRWARVFLLGESFTNFRGNNLNRAILFPMERIFEDYVAAMFRRHCTDYEVIAQDRRHHLVEQHKGGRKFRLRPDLVLRKEGQVKFVIDTKWKIIDETAPERNYDISQADMYQLFAYGKKYSGSTQPILMLIYPAHERLTRELVFEYETEGLRLVVGGWDLGDNKWLEGRIFRPIFFYQ
jgi:5-methylcytosine-specific restriction enzyme subunit McrC